MTTVVGIRFKDSGKTYYFNPNNLDLRQGEIVIVETVRGPEMAKVVYEHHDVPESDIVGELKPVVRHAEPADFERMQLLNARQDEVINRCAEKIQEHNLPMTLVKAEYSFDGSRLTFYFTSEKRVDFRMLVRDLARTFRSRIELRQIGPRDEAKLLGGIGPCGRLLCCATFLPDYARVSIKMAKDQDLPLNPAKISGVCGRLLCCLSYEHEQYVEMRAQLPRKGTRVQTPDGPGEVVGMNVLKQMLIVQLTQSGMQESYSLDQIRETTAQVYAVARSRAEEGITPATQFDQDDLDAYFQDAFKDDDSFDRNDQKALLDTLAWLEDGAAGAETTDTTAKPPSEDKTKRSRSRAKRRTSSTSSPSLKSTAEPPTEAPKKKSKRPRSRHARKPTSQTQPGTESGGTTQQSDKQVSSKGSQPEPAQNKAKAGRRHRPRRRSGADGGQASNDGK